MADREIGEEEVASFLGAVQVGHAGHGHAGQHGRGVDGGRLHAAVGHDASVLEGGVQEEVGIVEEGDVLLLRLVEALAFEDAKLHDGRRVHRATVGRRYTTTTIRHR